MARQEYFQPEQTLNDIFGSSQYNDNALSVVLEKLNINKIICDEENHRVTLYAEGRRSTLSGQLNVAKLEQHGYIVSYVVRADNDCLPVDFDIGRFNNLRDTLKYSRYVLGSTFPDFLEGLSNKGYEREVFDFYKRRKAPSDISIMRQIDKNYTIAKYFQEQITGF